MLLSPQYGHAQLLRVALMDVDLLQPSTVTSSSPVTHTVLALVVD